MRDDDPLRAGAPHFACPASTLLFEPRATGGLGITPAQELLAAGIKAVGHLRAAAPVAAATGAMSGQPDPWNWIASFDELRAEHPLLRDTPRARATWRAVMAAVVGAAGPNPERGENLLGGWKVAPEVPPTARQLQHARAAYNKLVIELDKATLKSKESAEGADHGWRGGAVAAAHRGWPRGAERCGTGAVHVGHWRGVNGRDCRRAAAGL